MRTSNLNAATEKGRDPGLFLGSLAGRCWVQCPRCNKAALVAKTGNGWHLSCTCCGHSDVIEVRFKRRPLGGPSRNRKIACVACGGTLSNAPWKGTLVAGQVHKIIRCRGCGRVSNYSFNSIPPDIRDGVDPSFGLPLYLSTSVGKHVLWALNPDHVAYLTDYLESDLRKRSLHPHYMTMMARLPHWMKAAKSRAAIMAALKRLEKMGRDCK